ncbi:MAG: hypothetical protein Q7T76_09065 [Ferruginibacter sp.]|nr:hypothetical protein [Ferruginibacter sp.]
MTHYDFLALSESEKHDALLNHGVKVAKRHDEKHNYLLYQMFSFYVEGKIEIATGKAGDIRSFTSTEPLKHYINSIDLSGLSS